MALIRIPKTDTATPQEYELRASDLNGSGLPPLTDSNGDDVTIAGSLGKVVDGSNANGTVEFTYSKNISNWYDRQTVTKNAGNKSAINISGEVNVLNSSLHPARKSYGGFFFGSDSAFDESNFTAGAKQEGLFLDMSLLSANHRSIVIINGNNSPSFSWSIDFSRNGIGDISDDQYEVFAGTSTGKITNIVLPSNLGYD